MGGLPLINAYNKTGFYFWDKRETEVVELKIGKIKVTIFRDTLYTYKADRFFINATPEEIKPALEKYRVTPDNIPSPFIAVLLQSGNNKILIDTGQGFSKKPVPNTRMMQNGRLFQLFEQEKINTSDITDVIITHLHPDHIGGIYDEDNQLQFPNAEFHIHEDEWDYWYSSQSAKQPELFKHFIEKNITPLKSKNINLIKGDFVEVLPGVTAVKADGHTPGQLALIIHSKKEHLLYISDAFLHPLHIEKLDWQTNYDLDYAKAKASRIKLLDLAYNNNMLINAFHFEFPGLGRVDKHQNHWIWNYEKGK